DRRHELVGRRGHDHARTEPPVVTAEILLVVGAIVGNLPDLPQPREREWLAVLAVDEVGLLAGLLVTTGGGPRFPLVEPVGRDQTPLAGEGPAVSPLRGHRPGPATA